MKNYQCLKAEIAKPQYVGMSDQQILDAINAPGSGVAIQGVTSMNDFKRWMAKQLPESLISKLRDYAINGTDPDAKSAAAGLIELLDELVMEFNMHNPKAQWALGALLSAGVITQQQRDEADSIGDTSQTTANNCGFNPAHLGHILHARTV